MYPNPSFFSNTDEALKSPNGLYKIEYQQLGEICMGGPLMGECFLIINNKRIKLHTKTGGPIVWNETNKKIALPIWTIDKKQNIAIVDLEQLTISVYKKEFSVLHLMTFNLNKIKGTDIEENFCFDINEEQIDTMSKLT